MFFRFNICRDSLDETKEICDEFIKEIFRPIVLKWDPGFLNMTEALTEGLWCMMPVLNKNVCLQYVYEMVRNEDVDEPVYSEVVKLNNFEKLIYYFIKFMMYSLKFDAIRVFQNYNMHFILYCTEKFPLLAYYRFKKTNFCVFHRYSEQRVVNCVS